MRLQERRGLERTIVETGPPAPLPPAASPGTNDFRWFGGCGSGKIVRCGSGSEALLKHRSTFTGNGALFYVLLSAGLLAFSLFAIRTIPWETSYDYWELAASVREASLHPLHPTNPIIDLPGNTSPRFTPYIFFWGSVMRITGLDVFRVLELAAAVNLLLFVTGLWRFVTKEIGNGSLPAVALLVMLLVWGRSWNWTNAYHLELFPIVLSYYGTFAFALSLHVLRLVSDWLERGGHMRGTLFALLAVTLFITHPITGVFCFAAVFALPEARRNTRRAALFLVVPAAAFLATFAWPWFDYWTIFTRGTRSSWFNTPLFRHQVSGLGTALYGVPAAIHLAWNRGKSLPLAGIVICAAIYFFSLAAGVAIGGRFILYGALFLHLAIAATLHNTWRSRRRWLVAPMIVLLLPAVTSRVSGIRAHAGRISFDGAGAGRVGPAGEYLFLRPLLHEGDIVLSEKGMLVIPALTGARSVTTKPNPLIIGEAQRRRSAGERFFDPATASWERREILAEYGVTHVLLDIGRDGERAGAIRADLEGAQGGGVETGCGEPVGRNGSLLLYAVTPALTETPGGVN